jgi:hypothetical protein
MWWNLARSGIAVFIFYSPLCLSCDETLQIRFDDDRLARIGTMRIFHAKAISLIHHLKANT